MEQKLLLIAVLFSFVYESSAINCFYCNSANNSACADVLALEPELRARIIPAVHCETAVPAPASVRFFCRKITQTTTGNNSACADVLALEPELRARIIPAVHCETAVPAPASVRFFCRKITQTTTGNNSACADVLALEPELRARIIPAVHCETAVPAPASVRFFCRKITQTIFHSHRDSEVRVTRGCGWVRHHRECYKADNADHLETVCQCFEDHCNGSGRVNAAIAVAALCAFGRLLLS